jgi:hypothetical protein
MWKKMVVETLSIYATQPPLSYPNYQGEKEVMPSFLERRNIMAMLSPKN